MFFKTKKQDIPLLLFCILISHLAGILGSFFTVSSIDSWYVNLDKPIFNPPNWIFGPVWLTLYTMMGIALYIIWHRNIRKKKVRQAVKLFLIHLVFNAAWSIIFFEFHQMFIALLVIIALWIMILMLIARFYELNKIAGYLLIPYILWVSFASVLNASLWMLNR
jgi:translocator protein